MLRKIRVLLDKNLLENIDKRFKFTWGYSGKTTVGKHFVEKPWKLELFKDLVEKYWGDLFEDKETEGNPESNCDLVMISFDPYHLHKSNQYELEAEYIEKITDIIGDNADNELKCILKKYKLEGEEELRKVTNGVPDDELMSHFEELALAKKGFEDEYKKAFGKYKDKAFGQENRLKAEFKKYFKLVPVKIPCCFGGKDTRYALRILLLDHIAAKFWLPFLKEDRISEQNELETAGDLLTYLFEEVIEEFSIPAEPTNVDVKEGDQLKVYSEPDYIPLPVIEELLKIMYRLKPADCVTLPIRYGENDTDYIRLPKTLGDRELQDYLAHYVCGKIVNRAMSRGFEYCEIGMSELKPPESGEVDWEKVISDAYDSNSYASLTEKYYNDYQTEESNVKRHADVPPSDIRRPPINNLSGEIKKCYDYLKCKGKDLVLGIDIGGSGIKYCFYKFDENGNFLVKSETDSSEIQFQPLEYWQTSKLATKIDRDYSGCGEFIKRIVDDIKEKHGCDARRIAAIGIAWPGAVKENRIAALSGIIMNFERYSWEKDIDIRKVIKELDIVATFKSCWKKKFSGDEPVISMFNDGDAHAFGSVFTINKRTEIKEGVVKTLVEKLKDENCYLAVLKAGTGTAGAIFSNEGYLVIGCPMEWGKLFLDLGPTFKPPYNNYPQGLVNLYCSEKTLPRLAKQYNCYKYLEEIGVTSFEIGSMLKKCSFEERKRLYGKNDIEIKQFQDMATECVTKLGYFVADTIALLSQNYSQMRVIVLGGGVLSGETRTVVIKEAKERLTKLYGKELEDGNEYCGEFKTDTFYYFTESDEEELDYGIFGAALLGAREMIFHRKQQGIKAIRQRIQEMDLNMTATLYEEKFDVIEKEDDPIELKEYSLSKEEVVDKFLTNYGTRMGLFYSTTEDEAITYIRWSQD